MAYHDTNWTSINGSITTNHSSFLNVTSQPRSSVFVWTSRTTFLLLNKIGAVILNAIILYLFLKNRHLRTPFNFYLFNLSFWNFSHGAIPYALQLLSEVNTSLYLGRPMCLVIRYLVNIIPACLNNSHGLIALHRFWAVTFPVSFRHFFVAHTASTHAFYICAGMYVYVHLTLMPGIIIDALYVRIPPEILHCSPILLGQSPEHQITTQMLVFDLPIVLVVLVYPFIFYKTFKRQRAVKVSNTSESNKKVTQKQPTSVSNGSNKEPTSVFTKIGKRLAIEKGAFVTTTVLTVSMLVCSMPAQLYYTLFLFKIVIAGGYPIITSLYALTAFVDPILILGSARDFRKAFRKLLRL